MLFVLLLASRFVYLGCDLPNRCIGWYTMMDSFYYTSNTFDLLFAGTYHPKNIPFTTTREAFELFQKMATYVSLRVFGNSFFGFLLPPVLLSIGSILCIYKVLDLNIQKNRYMIAGLVFYMSTDFYFLLTSRIQSPVIYSVFGISLSLFVFNYYLNQKNTSWAIFLLGFISFGTVLFIYVYTLFVFVAFASTLFVILIIQQRKWRHFLFFLLGILASFLFFNLALYSIAQLTIVDLLHGFVAHGGSGLFVAGKLKVLPAVLSYKQMVLKLVIPFISVASTNFFRFNISILGIFIVVFGCACYRLVKLKFREPWLLFLCLAVVFCLLQAFGDVYFYQRKLMMLLPLVLLFVSTFHGEVLFSNLKAKQKWGLLALVIASFVVCLYVFWLTTASFYGQGVSVEEGGANTSLLFNALNLGVFLLLLGRFLFVFFVAKERSFFKSYLLLLIFVPGLFLSFKYIYASPKFTMRSALIKVHELVGKSRVVGGSPYQFSLYNEITPLYASAIYYHRDIEYKTLMSKQLTEGKVDYSVFYYYEKPRHVSVGDTLSSGSNYDLVAQAILPLWQYGPKVCVARCFMKK